MNRSRPIKKAAGIFFDLSSGSLLSGFVKILVAILLFCSSIPLAQTNVRIAGHVYDEVDGHPLASASISISDTDYRVFSDPTGYFHFDHLPAGDYTLVITAEGYHEKRVNDVRVTIEFSARVSVKLTRKIYHLKDRQVSEQSRLPVAGDYLVLDRESILRSGPRNLGEALNAVEGVYVRETGPGGGKARVTIRGSKSEHVLVLIDGQRINPAGDGVADLNTVPLEMVERVEIYRGGQSARFGPDALGGVVNIITSTGVRHTRGRLSTGLYGGKWKTRRYRFVLQDILPRDNTASKFACSYYGTDGDFEYNYAVTPRPELIRTYSGVRLNAFVQQHNYFWSVSRNYGGRFSLSHKGQVFLNRNGLPGAVSKPDTTAFSEDNRTLVSAQGNYAGQNHHFEFLIGFSRFTQYHNNLEHPRDVERFQSRYINDIYDFQLKAGKVLGYENRVSAGFDLQRNILRHEDLLRPAASMGEAARDNAGLYVNDYQKIDLDGLPFWDVASIDISTRWDRAEIENPGQFDQDPTGNGKSNHWSYKAGFSLAAQNPVELVVRGSYGKSYRLPSFNALFWKGDARSQIRTVLKQEKAEHSDIGFEFRLKWGIDFSGGVTYFHTYVHDLIEWRSGYLGVWYPDNIAAARITGHEDFLRISLLGEKICLDYQNSVTIARNLEPGGNIHNKYLTYRPHYITRISAALKLWKFRGNYAVRLVGRRYSLEANTKWYDPYRVDDLKIGFETRSGKFAVNSAYQIKNLHGEHYVLIGQYPMPGREWGFEFSLVYHFDIQENH